MISSTYILLLGLGLILVCHGELELAIIHSNDVHARVEQTNQFSAACPPKDVADDKCFGGMARMWTKIKELRSQFPDNSLLIDAGNQYQGSLWSVHYKGLETSYFMNYMGYDVMTYGTREFDFGLENTRNFTRDLKCPIVSSNLDAGNSVLRGAYLPSHTVTINQVKVGVVGYITTNLFSVQDASNIQGLTVTDEIEAVRKEAIKLKSQGVDIIIAVGHAGYETDLRVAREVDQVDIVVGGYSETFLYSGTPPSNDRPAGAYPTVVEHASGSKALVVQAFAYTKYLGFLKVTFADDGKVKSWQGQPFLLDSSIKQDPQLQAMVTQWALALEPLTSDIIGQSNVFLEGDTIENDHACRRRECNLGNVVTDAVLLWYIKGRAHTATGWSDVAIAVWNGGGITADIAQGPISLGDVLLALPFRNTVQMVDVTGAIVLQMLENSVSAIEDTPPNGRFLQMSGLTVKYNLANLVGQRVVSVMVQCSGCVVPQMEPLEKTKNYKMLVNNYMANGGNDYTMIPQSGRVNIGTLGADALKGYIERSSPIVTGLQKRIEFVTEQSQPTCKGHAIRSSGAIMLLATFICVSVYHLN